MAAASSNARSSVKKFRNIHTIIINLHSSCMFSRTGCLNYVISNLYFLGGGMKRSLTA